MYKTLGIIILLLSPALFAKAQVKKQELVGEWQLVELIDKQISENEKLKRYTYTTDSLIYNSPRRNVKGTYKVNEQSGQCFWYIAGSEQPISLMLKKINKDTLHLWQTEGLQTVGVLKRINK
ncbi:hypothetical protein [Pedobacter sp.]